MEYDFFYTRDHFGVMNAANGLGFIIYKEGYSVYSLQEENKDAAWKIEVMLGEIRRFRRKLPFELSGGCVKQGNHLVYYFGFAQVEYLNTERGLRQNFIINKRIAGKGKLVLNLQLKTALSRKLINDNRMIFHHPASEKDIKMVFEDLNVWDARQIRQKAYMRLDRNGLVLSIVVDDSKAVYPITIDPLNRSKQNLTFPAGVFTCY